MTDLLRKAWSAISWQTKVIVLAITALTVAAVVAKLAAVYWGNQ